MNRRENFRTAEGIALIVLFVVALWMPILISLSASSSGRFNMAEKRKMAEMPKLDGGLSSIKEFPASFSKYYDDNFGFRETLIGWHNHAKGMLLRISPAPNAIIGKQGWLFLGDGNIVADYRATHPFTNEELERWRIVLEGKRNWLAAQGILYLFLVAPDKHSIYPEFIPDHINRVGSETCLDQLVAYLKAHSDVNIMDLRPALREGKGAARVFHKTDTHWNEQGAYIAYTEIMARVSGGAPSLRPKRPDDFRYVKENTEGHDIANMMGLKDVFTEQDIHLFPKRDNCAHEVDFKLDMRYSWPQYSPEHAPYARECENSKLRMVFFQDSFGTALVPFLSEHFRRTVYIWDYPGYAVMNAAIRQEHPDIVIEERVERHLKPMLPDFDIPADLVGKWVSNNNKVEIKHLSSSSVSLVSG